MKTQYILGASSTIFITLMGISSALPTPLSVESKVGIVPSLPGLKQRDTPSVKAEPSISLTVRGDALQNPGLAQVRSPPPVVGPLAVTKREVAESVAKRWTVLGKLKKWTGYGAPPAGESASAPATDGSAPPSKREVNENEKPKEERPVAEHGRRLAIRELDEQ